MKSDNERRHGKILDFYELQADKSGMQVIIGIAFVVAIIVYGAMSWLGIAPE